MMSLTFIPNLLAYLVTSITSFNFIEFILSLSTLTFSSILPFFQLMQKDPPLVLLKGSPGLLGKVTNLLLFWCFFYFLQCERIFASYIEMLILLKDRWSLSQLSPNLFTPFCIWSTASSLFSVLIKSLTRSLQSLMPNSGVCLSSWVGIFSCSYQMDCMGSYEIVSSHNLKYYRSVMPLYSCLFCACQFLSISLSLIFMHFFLEKGFNSRWETSYIVTRFICLLLTFI